MKRKLTLLVTMLFALTMHLQAMQIFVTNPTTGTLALDVEAGSSILEVKTKIFDQTSISESLMTLKYSTTLLEAASTLFDYGIGSGATLALILPSGTGTIADPYQIATLDNLYWLSQTQSVWVGGTFFIQTADIDAAATSGWDGGAGFLPIGLSDPSFAGNFNGNYKTIFNLFINRPALAYVGLFGYSDGTIKNLTLNAAYVNGGASTGILAGSLGGRVSNCHATGTVTGKSGTGGLVGQLSGSLSACSAYVTTSFSSGGLQSIGGLVGEFIGSDKIISNCFALGNVDGHLGTSFIGGLAGNMAANNKIEKCYSAGQVNGGTSTTQGGLIGYNDGAVNNSFWDTETSLQANSAGGTGKTTALMQTQSTFTDAGWDFDIFWGITASNYPNLNLRLPTYGGGIGTLESPFQIATLNQLVQLSLFPDQWDKHFIQTADIDASATILPGPGIILNPIGDGPTPFSGSYDGHNYTIDQLYQNVIAFAPSGLFGNSDGATIKNIHLTNVQIAGLLMVGGLVGQSVVSDFSNCHVTGTVSAILVTGGFVGFSMSNTFTTCSANVTVTGNDVYGTEMMTHLGGFAGIVHVNSSFTDCYARGAVSGYQVGGFIGGVDMNSSAFGDPIAIDLTSGFTLTNCYAANTLSGTLVNGGLYGQDAYAFTGITIINSFWDKDLAGTTEGFVGGIGKTTVEMKTQSTFTNAGWDLTTTPIWHINAVDNDGYPHLAFDFNSLTWDGSESTDWNTPANWSNNVVPISTDNVLIPNVANDPVIASGLGATCNNITINGDASLTVQSGGSLITLGAVTGNATIQRIVTGSSDLEQNKYHLVSVPLATSNLSQSSLFTGSYLYQYLPATNAWQGMGTTTTTELDETVGYMIYYPNTSKTYNFTGVPNSGPFTTTVTYPGNAPEVGNFALVPNPYPSNIDWNATTGWTKTNIGTSIWIYNNGNYGVWDGTNSTLGGSRYIGVGQAFFVQTMAASPVLVMDNSVRTHSTANFLKNGSTIANQLRVKAEANTMVDELLVGFGENTSNNYDAGEDALKLQGAATAPQLYTLADDIKLSINNLTALNNSALVPMNFETGFEGNVTLTFSQMESFPVNLSIRLLDKLTSQLIDLRKQQTYTFTHLQSNTSKRFELLFGSATGIEEPHTIDGNIWISNKTVNINCSESVGEKAKVEILNAAGQVVFRKQITLSQLTQVPTNISGFAVVRVSTDRAVWVAKGIF